RSRGGGRSECSGNRSQSPRGIGPPVNGWLARGPVWEARCSSAARRASASARASPPSLGSYFFGTFIPFGHRPFLRILLKYHGPIDFRMSHGALSGKPSQVYLIALARWLQICPRDQLPTVV